MTIEMPENATKVRAFLSALILIAACAGGVGYVSGAAPAGVKVVMTD